MPKKTLNIGVKEDESIFDDVFAAEGSSFDKLEPDAPAPAKEEKKFIITRIVVDKFTTVCRREELTPSRCTVYGCTFDVAKNNGFPQGWHTVPQRERGLMLEALQEHIRLVHNHSEDHIISESALPKRWLGQIKDI